MMIHDGDGGTPGALRTQTLRAQWHDDGDHAWVSIAGPVDVSSRFDLLTAVLGRYHRGVRHVVVDLAEVTELDGEAVRTLGTSRRVLEATGAELRLCNVPERLRHLL